MGRFPSVIYRFLIGSRNTIHADTPDNAVELTLPTIALCPVHVQVHRQRGRSLRYSLSSNRGGAAVLTL